MPQFRSFYLSYSLCPICIHYRVQSGSKKKFVTSQGIFERQNRSVNCTCGMTLYRQHSDDYIKCSPWKLGEKTVAPCGCKTTPVFLDQPHRSWPYTLPLSIIIETCPSTFISTRSKQCPSIQHLNLAWQFSPPLQPFSISVSSSAQWFKRSCINSLLNCMINIFVCGPDHDLFVFPHNSCSFFPFIFSSRTTSRNIFWVSDNTNVLHCHRQSKLMHSFLNTFMGYRLLWETAAAESSLLLDSKEALVRAWNHPCN